ncbi:MAG: cyclopropane-fatty-acyl-phospholipid synthase family protein [Pseudomonadota bacterium]
MADYITASAKTIRQLQNVPASFKLAGFALLSADSGTLVIQLPDGRSVKFDSGVEGTDAEIHVHEYSFAKRAISSGDIGFAESYMDGEWSTPDLTAVLRYFSDNFDAVGNGNLARGRALMKWINKIRHGLNKNSRKGARRNIMSHYDLGNEFYSQWLDPSMTYSSGIYASPNTSLEHSQAAKYDAICNSLDLGSKSEVLEIGCGWGGFAEYAASQRGAKVTCLTISEAQREYAEARMRGQGLEDRVEIRLEDYRDHRGAYDAVASIEMFEAVGERYWPDYFSKIQSVLKPGARAALQIITIDDQLFESYRTRTDFIQRYIFPGGMLPSEEALKDQFSQADLRYDETRYFGQDYARTLNSWAKRFNDAWPDIAKLGFDQPFQRMWNFYLSYCEAGFKGGRINVGQFVLSKPGSN